jgi:hypothetical protein
LRDDRGRLRAFRAPPRNDPPVAKAIGCLEPSVLKLRPRQPGPSRFLGAPLLIEIKSFGRGIEYGFSVYDHPSTEMKK